jgi:hypothetical protein
LIAFSRLIAKNSRTGRVWPCAVVEPLANTFLSIGARDNVQKTLIGFGVLHNGCSFAVNREHYRVMVFLSCFMKSPDDRRNVVSD